MNAKKIICLMIAVVLLGSLICLVKVLMFDKDYLHMTSYPRFISLIIVHLLAICYDMILIGLDSLKDILKWGFLFSANVTAFMTMT